MIIIHTGVSDDTLKEYYLMNNGSGDVYSMNEAPLAVAVEELCSFVVYSPHGTKRTLCNFFVSLNNLLLHIFSSTPSQFTVLHEVFPRLS